MLLAIWILLSGLDDLFLDIVWIARSLIGRRTRIPSPAKLSRIPTQSRIAILVPLWRESEVIRGMVEHNLAAIRYMNYHFFIGGYPNDEPTLKAVRDLEGRFPNVHLAVCPHDGPTSKADCLNQIYKHLLEFEQRQGVEFEVLMTHDAEDLIHPESLRLINYFSRSYDMIQIPVLPLPTSWIQFTHGVYCDEFADYLTREMQVRQSLGGFLPSCGVGTAFSRRAIRALTSRYRGRVFEPGCLTEDYENGFRVYRLGGRQLVLPITWRRGSWIATREYFPRRFRAAVRQRTRWMTGIALQSWELHGIRDTLRQGYWFWRDRKGLIGSLIGPPAMIWFLAEAAKWWLSSLPGDTFHVDWLVESSWIGRAFAFSSILMAFHTLVRMGCVARVYGFTFALGVPVRTLWGNAINLLATVSAIRRYFWAKLKRRQLVWLKTDHAYPASSVLNANRPKLGEILVRWGLVSPADLAAALRTQPKDVRLGEYLIRTHRLSESDLYRALAEQHTLPLSQIHPEQLASRTLRLLPAGICRKWRMIPVEIVAGELHVASSEVPSEEATQELRRYCRFPLRYHLVPPSNFTRLEQAWAESPSPSAANSYPPVAAFPSSTPARLAVEHRAAARG